MEYIKGRNHVVTKGLGNSQSEGTNANELQLADLAKSTNVDSVLAMDTPSRLQYFRDFFGDLDHNKLGEESAYKLGGLATDNGVKAIFEGLITFEQIKQMSFLRLNSFLLDGGIECLRKNPLAVEQFRQMDLFNLGIWILNQK